MVSFISSHFSSVFQVDFVAYEDTDSVVVVALFEQIEPNVYSIEGIFSGDVINKDSAVCISDIVGYETLELFLSSCVPELEAVECSFVVDIFDKEIDAYCFLYVDEGVQICWDRSWIV